jgi:predicted membrane metal-binding protein
MNWSDVDLRPDRKKLRQFAALLATIAIVLSVIDPLWAIVAVYGLLSLALPRLAYPVYAVLTVATFPIGWVVSRVMLALLFYVVLAPIALAQRLLRRDVLRLRRREDHSYWERVETDRDPASYLRQF